MPTIREIAELAGVSASTVSRALKDDPSIGLETRRRIVTIADERGYSRSATNGHLCGLVYLGPLTPDSLYDSSLLAGATRALLMSKRHLLIVNTLRDKPDDEKYSTFFRRLGLAGVIVRCTSGHRSICEEIAAEGFPMVVVGERFDDPAIGFVDGESEMETQRAIEYLATLGHQRIAFAMNRVSDGDHIDRLRGYKSALKRCGLEADESLVIRQNADVAGGASALKRMLSLRHPPTAAFFADPWLAVGAINMAHQMGVRIPEDFSIIGFDDAKVRLGTYPPMTSVCQDAAEVGFVAAESVVRAIEQPMGRVTQLLLPTTLEVSQSTAPPSNSPLRILSGGTHMTADTVRELETLDGVNE